MKRSLILEVCVKAEFHTLIIISLFMLFSGHGQPGGGFPGGLVAACAFCLRYVAGGPGERRRAAPVRPTVFLGVGMLFAIVTGAFSLTNGHQFLESSILSVEVPFIGPAKTSSMLFFDTGVYLVVLGMVLLVLEQLGGDRADDTDEQAAEREGVA
jgi:multisubunit Na+/H+ antiporter MnhB subunit